MLTLIYFFPEEDHSECKKDGGCELNSFADILIFLATLSSAVFCLLRIILLVFYPMWQL